MDYRYCVAALTAIALGSAAPGGAQASSGPDHAVNDAFGAGADANQPGSAAAASVMPAPSASTAVCELHVWPTQNYLGLNSGLLSGFGAIGAVLDMSAHEGKVKTVKDLMADYLGPEVQMDELNKIGISNSLKLSSYRIVVEEPTPFNEDLKDNPVLKAKVAALNARIKAKQRLSDSANPCYAELITTHIFYHKAMMYGSNLFTGWLFRQFDKGVMKKQASGQVKNPLEHFPPKSAEMIPAAQRELRDAFAKDFTEYVQKKVKP